MASDPFNFYADDPLMQGKQDLGDEPPAKSMSELLKEKKEAEDKKNYDLKHKIGESVEDRSTRMKQQRELLLQKKKEKRDTQLE
jgi:hypothetical protein